VWLKDSKYITPKTLHSDDGDGNAQKSTPLSTVNANGVALSTTQQEERGPGDSAAKCDAESQRSEQNDGDEGDDNKSRVQEDTATTKIHSNMRYNSKTVR